jgi:shikimate dehydrogenase
MGNLYGVIGCPIKHSMSPDIHNDAFKELKIDGYYHAFHVEPDQLNETVQALKVLGVKGFNVTIPHKVSIIPFLDELDETAKIVGAVNTVVNVNGRLVGYNTDGNGYIESLTKVLTKPISEHRFLIIGSGGAARGIYYTLAHQGCREIDICNRTVSKAEELIKECPFEHTSKALSIETAELQLEDYDIIIQTTAVGMHPNITSKPLSLKNAKHSAVISDIVYNPIKTALLIEAEELGLKVHNGVGMFVYQAVLAFQLWTKQIPAADRMTSIVYDKLGGTSC